MLWFPLIQGEQSCRPTNLVIGNQWASSRASYLSVLHEKRKVFVSYSTLSGEGKCWQYRLVYAASSLHLLNQYIGLISVPRQVVISKTKGQMFRYSFGNKTKRFGIVPGFVLLRTDCFNLVQNLFAWTKLT